ncbi:hypothetical protein NA78x_005173 [Anatilimnocola sp. NA78]|uniref:hypothetical protein n=1 Tax=Anatilimnocola sp. NA78 TaxID=3415683 RepID=UPI003CE52820
MLKVILSGFLVVAAAQCSLVEMASAQFVHDPFGEPGMYAEEPSPRQGQLAIDDDPDLEAILNDESKELTAEQQAVIAAFIGGQPLARQPERILKALAEKQKNPAKLTATPPAETNSNEPQINERPVAPSRPQVRGGRKPSTGLFTPPRGPGDPFGEEPQTEGEEALISPLATRILTGDWAEIKEFLAKLPKETAPGVYDGLLTMLMQDATGMVLPQEILRLSEAAPGELSERNLAQLGQLVRRSLQQAEKPTNLLTALNAGTDQLGGTDAARRVAAAKLLLAAGLVEEATPFLPSLREAQAAKDAAVVNLHARHKWLLHRKKQEAAELLRAWELTQAVLSNPEAKELHPVCIKRTLKMSPRVPRDVAGEWFRRVFKDDPATGIELLKEVSREVAESFRTSNDELRGNALFVQQLAGTELLVARGLELGDWSVALEVLTRGWLNEAQKTAGGPLRKLQVEDDERVEPLQPAAVLRSAPGPAWLNAIGDDTADHIRHLTGLLAARAGQGDVTMALIYDLTQRDPELARALAEALLTAVTGGSEQNRAEMEEFGMSLRHYPPQQRAYLRRQLMQQRGRSGAPVTRAGQLRNLARMSELLAAFERARVPALGEQVRVQAFASCHSPAEVYRAEDIEQMFGSLEELPAEIAVPLAESMRTGLAQSWRDPQAQQQQSTKRTPEEQAAEIVRGYALTIELLHHAAARAPDRVDLLLLIGNTHFHLAEFQYGQQVDLKTYTRERDAAFKAYAKAAEMYAKNLPNLPTEKQSIDVFRQWFQAALGTSDLTYLTRQDEPDASQVQKISQAITDLKLAGDHHRQLFAATVQGSLEQIPATLKPHFVRQALVVIGNHPAAKELKERLAAYDDLLKEVELRLTLDGSDSVGHGRPFGAYISLAGTRAVLRENDAFPALLYVQVGRMSQQVDTANNPRERLEQEIREKLGQAFLVEALVFHPPQTRPRSFGREGWQELPLAYVVLRAKDEAVDRLPSLQFDMEFSDGEGQVRLPIQSQVVLLDARAKSPPPRPAREVKIRELLDDRGLDKGNVLLEIVATAYGLVPELDQLVKEPGKFRGFDVKQTTEQSLSITSVEASEKLAAQTERRWLIELTPQAETPPSEFQFAVPASDKYAVTYQRYDDADISETKATTPLRWPVIHTASRWLWPLLGVIAVAVALGAIVVWLRRQSGVHFITQAYVRPEKLTPFSLLGLLRRIAADTSLRFTAAEQQSLRDTIAQLESQYFRRGEATSATELDPIATQWLSRVARTA